MRLKCSSIVAGILVLALAGSAAAAERVYDLVAGTKILNLPDGASVTQWGFGFTADAISVPGPALEVAPGESLRVNLTNGLAVPISIIIPGQAMPTVDGAASQPARNPDGRIRSFTIEVAAGGAASYVWPLLKPGTYLYHSGTHPAVQVQMGLYGAVECDASVGEVYAGQAYAQDLTLVFSEIDPAFHAKVDAAIAAGQQPSATVDYAPKYFLVNGKPYDPASADPIPAVPAGTRTLLRLLNAGLETHAPMLLGTRTAVIAEDGNPYLHPRDQYTIGLAAGKTIDAIVQPATAGMISILDRRLFLASGGHVTAGGTPIPPGGTGGMLTLIQVQ
jgi:FtsP/CotA-like multicopper oxidase with cupredoxin domain